MKAIKIAVIFAIILEVLYVLTNINMEKQLIASRYKKIYDRAISTATSDATDALIPPYDTDSIKLSSEGYSAPQKRVLPNLDKATYTFFQSMYLNFGIEDDPTAQLIFNKYVPALIVTSYDGYYIYSTLNYTNITTGKKHKRPTWSIKKPYSFYDEIDNAIIYYTLDDNVSVYNLNTGTWDKGRYLDLSSKYPGALFNTSNFEGLRKQVITNSITKDLSGYTYYNNAYAKQIGYTYSFNLPFLNSPHSIDYVCFLAFFQGLPLKGEFYYNTYSFKTAQINSSNRFLCNVVNAINYYHKPECMYAAGSDIVYNSKKEAAINGYYPCIYCNP